jgi:hypothetical protein
MMGDGAEWQKGQEKGIPGKANPSSAAGPHLDSPDPFNAAHRLAALPLDYPANLFQFMPAVRIDFILPTKGILSNEGFAQNLR